MTEIQKLLFEMKNPNNIKTFERDYGMCFLQECAEISTNVLTFGLNHATMFIYNSFDEEMSDEEFFEFTNDYLYFDDFGKGIQGLSFDCSEDEFNAAKLKNKNVVFSDLPVLKEMYKNFEKYLDMNAVKKYANEEGNVNGTE